MHGIPSTAEHDLGRRLAAHLDHPFRDALAALAFWIAIALPALYLPLLVAGIQSTDGLVTFLGFLGLHLVALVGGRRYRTATH